MGGASNPRVGGFPQRLGPLGLLRLSVIPLQDVCAVPAPGTSELDLISRRGHYGSQVKMRSPPASYSGVTCVLEFARGKFRHKVRRTERKHHENSEGMSKVAATSSSGGEAQKRAPTVSEGTDPAEPQPQTSGLRKGDTGLYC